LHFIPHKRINILYFKHVCLDGVVKLHRKVYLKVSGLAAWCENYKWHSSLPTDAVVSLFFESV